MILIFIPLIIPFILESIRYKISLNNVKKEKIILIPLILLAAFNLKHLPSQIKANKSSLKAYFGGDAFYDYTRDWKNYLSAASWAEKKLAPRKYTCL